MTVRPAQDPTVGVEDAPASRPPRRAAGRLPGRLAMRRLGGLVEPPARPLTRPRDLRRDVGRTEVVNGLVGALFSMTGPVAVILAAGDRAGLSTTEVTSWIFAVFTLNGLLTILASWLYRQPLAFFWTIPGTVVVGQAGAHLPWTDVLGAYLLTAALLLGVGLVGRIDKVMHALPMPVVMAMVAGVFLQFGIGAVDAVGQHWQVAAPMVVVFFLATALPRLGAWVPPIIGALVVGALVVAVTGGYAPEPGTGGVFATPVVQAPTFSWAAAAELVLPLAVTVVFVQNGQGMAVLTGAGHRAPMRFATIACGLWSFPSALVGGVSTCLTGPTNALLTASGAKERQYVAGVTCGAIAVMFGLTAPTFVGFLLAMPAAFIAALAGLALLKALTGAFSAAFSGSAVTAPLVTFLVTISEIDYLNLGAPFWGLVAGVLVARLVESPDRRVG